MDGVTGPLSRGSQEGPALLENFPPHHVMARASHFPSSLCSLQLLLHLTGAPKSAPKRALLPKNPFPREPYQAAIFQVESTVSIRHGGPRRLCEQERPLTSVVCWDTKCKGLVGRRVVESDLER